MDNIVYNARNDAHGVSHMNAATRAVIIGALARLGYTGGTVLNIEEVKRNKKDDWDDGRQGAVVLADRANRLYLRVYVDGERLVCELGLPSTSAVGTIKYSWRQKTLSGVRVKADTALPATVDKVAELISRIVDSAKGEATKAAFAHREKQAAHNSAAAERKAEFFRQVGQILGLRVDKDGDLIIPKTVKHPYTAQSGRWGEVGLNAKGIRELEFNSDNYNDEDSKPPRPDYVEMTVKLAADDALALMRGLIGSKFEPKKISVDDY